MHPHTHDTGAQTMKEWPNTPAECSCTSSVEGWGSAQHVCYFGSVMFSILARWCGGFLLLGRGRVPVPGLCTWANSLINSARSGHRWQVGNDTGCATTPPPPTPAPPTPAFLPVSDSEISQISMHSLLLMDHRRSPTSGYGGVWAARARTWFLCLRFHQGCWAAAVFK